MPKIMLDAGHYGKYNRSPAVRTYWESLMNWELHLYLKAELEARGFKVDVTRQDQAKDMPLMERGRKSRGYDLFLSLHSNAVGSTVNEEIDYPVAYVQLSGKADKIGQMLATCVQNTMQTRQKGYISKRKLDGGGDYYGVIRGAAEVGTPGLILEHSFHTQTRAATWLSSSENLKKMAHEEAKILAKYFGMQEEPSGGVTIQWYRIRKSWNDPSTQLGAYEKLDGAVKNCPFGYSVFDHTGKKVYTNGEQPDVPVEEYLVRVEIDNLNIRRGPSTLYDKLGEFTGKGVFTIVEEADGAGATKWGLLKSYAKNRDGWISLDYAKRI